LKVFISWSGDRSKSVAKALRDWLPRVIQNIDPWMSADDIDKGSRWGTDIATQLEEASVGIICLTPDNVKAPWILFEAGALSKTLDDTFVCPYLFELNPTEIEEPLTQFQATTANKEDTEKLMSTINRAQKDNALQESLLTDSFERWWPDLEEALGEIPEVQQNIPRRTQQGILEEILRVVRGISRTSASSPESQTRVTVLEDDANNRIYKLTSPPVNWKKMFAESQEKARELSKQMGDSEQGEDNK